MELGEGSKPILPNVHVIALEPLSFLTFVPFSLPNVMGMQKIHKGVTSWSKDLRVVKGVNRMK